MPKNNGLAVDKINQCGLYFFLYSNVSLGRVLWLASPLFLLHLTRNLYSRPSFKTLINYPGGQGFESIRKTPTRRLLPR